MKRGIISGIFLCLALFCLPFSLGSQEIDIDPNQIDVSKVDLSRARLYFQGPMELYLSGLRYEGASYAAVLEYDGASEITVSVPEKVTDRGKPSYVDLATANFSFEAGKITVRGILVDGMTYRGSFAFEPENRLFRLVELAGTDAVEAAFGGSTGSADSTLKTVIRQQELRIEELEDDLAKKDETIIGLSSKLRETPQRPQKNLEQVKKRLSSPIYSGFDAEASLIYGDWKLSGARLSQNDPDNYFAKYGMTLLQSEEEYLYSLKASSAGEGWRGYGLHFAASAVESLDTYCFGESYLVWVTRDYRHNRTDKTFVELYKSDGNGTMIRLVSKAVYYSIKEDRRLDIHADNSQGRITVYYGEEEVFSYRDRRMIKEGDLVALRSLGKAEFTDFVVFK